MDSCQDQHSFVTWTRLQYPNGTWIEPLLGPATIRPPLNVTLSRRCSQSIPANYPAGNYLYKACTAINYTFGGPLVDSSSFAFIKSTSADGRQIVWEASCTGEPFPGEVISSQPPAISLCTVSPNPFNPTTAISYQLSANSHVSLKVYDTAGRLVTTLVDGWREAGEYEAIFDGAGLSSGIYLYQLTMGTQTLTGKMILLK